MRSFLVLSLALVSHAALPSMNTAEACAPVPLPGFEVAMGDEDVIIVWDAERGRQHFIRKAHFETGGDEFAFLVPTPSEPTLSETEDATFTTLSRAIQPEEIVDHDWQIGTCLTLSLGAMFVGASRGPMEGSSGAPPIEVLGAQTVAGLDATILRVNDATALPEWLESNGYPQPPDVLEWVQPYVDRDYILTAFKFHKSEDGVEDVATSAVRMSFDTDQPFYPYREPQSASGGDGSMRIYFIASDRVAATIAGDAWAADVSYAAPMTDDTIASLQPLLPGTELASGHWLTVFHDSLRVRPDEDVRFRIEPGDEVVPAPRHIEGSPIPIPIPLEIILPLGLVWWFRRRKKQAGEA